MMNFMRIFQNIENQAWQRFLLSLQNQDVIVVVTSFLFHIFFLFTQTLQKLWNI